LLLTGLILLESCSSYRYQIFDLASPEVVEYRNNYYVYNHNNVELHYDFWSDGGSPIIEFINNSDSIYYFSLDSSWIQVNKVRYLFDEERMFTLEREVSTNTVKSVIDSFFNSPYLMQIDTQSILSIEGYPALHDQLKIKPPAFSTTFTPETSPAIIITRICVSTSKKGNNLDCFYNSFYVDQVNLGIFKI
jgi:hypothetical protein